MTRRIRLLRARLHGRLERLRRTGATQDLLLIPPPILEGQWISGGNVGAWSAEANAASQPLGATNVSVGSKAPGADRPLPVWFRHHDQKTPQVSRSLPLNTVSEAGNCNTVGCDYHHSEMTLMRGKNYKIFKVLSVRHFALPTGGVTRPKLSRYSNTLCRRSALP